MNEELDAHLQDLLEDDESPPALSVVRGKTTGTHLYLPGVVTATSLTLPDGLAFEEWEGVGAILDHIGGAWQWWYGDWYRYGEKHYGDSHAQALPDKEVQTKMNAAWVAGQVEISRRRENLSWSHHSEVAALEPVAQDLWLERASEEGWTREELRQEIRLSKLPQAPADTRLQVPRSDYQIVLADPPWQYDSWNAKGTGRVADQHYPTMGVDAICDLPVSSICAKDAILLLWVTLPLLREGLRVMEAWGFDYRTTFLVWGKLNADKSPAVGFGRYTRSNGELCLLGKRGAGVSPRQGVAVANLLLSQRERHSQKPAAQYDIIHRVFGREVRRVELFARQRMAGWDVWGLEAPEAVTMQDLAVPA